MAALQTRPRLTQWGAVAVALAIGATGCASKSKDSASTGASSGTTAKSCKIAIDNGSGTSFPFPSSEAKGAADQAKALGCQVVANLDGKSNPQTEAANVQNIIALKPDGVVMMPSDAAEAASLVDSMASAGIKVVSSHSVVGAKRKLQDVYPTLSALVIENEVGAGKQAAELLTKALPKGGKIAVILGAPGYAENQLRVQDFKPAIAGKFTIVATQPADWVADKGQSACSAILNAHSDIVGVYSLSDDMGVGCAKAVSAAHSKALVVGVGGSKLGISEIKAGGNYFGTICYKPYDEGKAAVTELHKAITDPNYGKAKLVFYDTPSITKENVDQCQPQW